MTTETWSALLAPTEHLASSLQQLLEDAQSANSDAIWTTGALLSRLERVLMQVGEVDELLSLQALKDAVGGDLSENGRTLASNIRVALTAPVFASLADSQESQSKSSSANEDVGAAIEILGHAHGKADELHALILFMSGESNSESHQETAYQSNEPDPDQQFIDLTKLSSEPYVKQAVNRAIGLAGDDPLGPWHLLKAAILDPSSKSFQTVASLLPIDVVLPESDGREYDLQRVSVTGALASGYEVALPFLQSVPSVWGRDFVTLSLLTHDPLLELLARDASTTISQVRDSWFEYVVLD